MVYVSLIFLPNSNTGTEEQKLERLDLGSYHEVVTRETKIFYFHFPSAVQ